jgi:small subunit ribosomal protein S19
MNRSKWKIPFTENSLRQKLELKIQKKEVSAILKTQSRSSTITSDFVGMPIRLYNGKIYSLIQISSEMVGHKLGEFVFTRARYEFKKKKKKK